MEKTFGIDNEIIEKALKNGILVIKDGFKTKPVGFFSLAYLVQLNEFIITYGMNPQTSGFVFVKDFKTTWDLE